MLKQMDQMIMTCICRTLSEFLPKELCKENLGDQSVPVIWDWGSVCWCAAKQSWCGAMQYTSAKPSPAWGMVLASV